MSYQIIWYGTTIMAGGIYTFDTVHYSDGSKVKRICSERVDSSAF